MFFMKISRFFVTLLLIGALFFMVTSSSMAETRFSIDKQSIEAIVKQSMDGNGFGSSGYTEIASKVKLQNSSDRPLSFDVTVTFVNSGKDKLGEATKTCKIKAGESKVVSNLVLLDPSVANQIDSGYVTIANDEIAGEAESHSIIATVGDDFKENINIADVSDRYVKIDYNVKLRNKSSKPVTSDLTIAFLDEDNVKIKEARTKGTFEAGELKTITDTIVLRTSDAARISKSHVIIEK